MKLSLPLATVKKNRGSLRKANNQVSSLYPGDSLQRHPVHTVYGGAQIFKANTARKMGEIALQAVRQNAPDAQALAHALGIESSPETLDKVYSRVQEKLKREPVEDFRIDFEDGYGSRPDAEEDAHAQSAAEEVAQGQALDSLPPFIGIRIKPFTEELFSRSLRTLDLFITHLAKRTNRRLPEHFYVTLPKITSPQQVSSLAWILGQLEAKLKLIGGSLKIELMIETPQSLFGPTGEAALPSLVAASDGRCVGAHFGAYDYTASCGITAAHQHMLHSSCDFARQMMQISLAGTGVALSDGATNIMPVGPHRLGGDKILTANQSRENQQAVHKAWRLSYEHIRHSLVNGFYQGWDLHPAQIPIRYAAIYTFFVENLAPASFRLKSFIEKAAQASLHEGVFDDAATGQGLLGFFLRGISCGAIQEEEILPMTGLTLDELRSRSFLKILTSRRDNPPSSR